MTLVMQNKKTKKVRVFYNVKEIKIKDDAYNNIEPDMEDKMICIYFKEEHYKVLYSKEYEIINVGANNG